MIFAPQAEAFLVTVQTAGYSLLRPRGALQKLPPASGEFAALPAAASLQEHTLFYEPARDPAEAAVAGYETPGGQPMSFREIQRLLPTARRILSGGD